MRRLLTLIALLATIAAIAPAAASANGGDNAAIAINTSDDTSIVDIAFKVHRVMNGTVDQGNAAVAFASCENCRATAIAIQAVLVGAQAETVTPTNLAIAINQNCTSCVAMAFAYQFVLGTDGPAHFTAEGNRALNDIRHRLHDLRDTQLSPADLQAELDVLVAELRTVLRDELVTPGARGESRPGESESAPDAPPADETETTPEEPSPSDGSGTEAGPGEEQSPEDTGEYDDGSEPEPEGSSNYSGEEMTEPAP